ncbi:MAG TPA: ABC transporter substrate-binding protein [Intrasporangium sp.]|uniref:ABC transporter substrate-binding protein n=1 Tax=Intrasporangium sp. TaxID=1925024 RepID=UPI002D7A0103|nr:ABC transporter substrate-binding protein [Intrasporangium sp.]HET7400095.1 ABC transporter substrate-binding protein [Intrasporangium sp.]
MKKAWFIGVALVAPLGLTACGGSGTGGAAAPGAGAGGTIKIASLHPLSGAAAADGQQMDNGAKLAAEAINAAGGIKSLGGAKLEIVSADSQGKPEVGQSEAQRLIQEGAVGIVGTYQSAVSANVATVAERNKVPFVIDVSSADSILSQGYKYTFRVQPSASVIGQQGAQYLFDVSKAAGKPVKKVAFLHEQGPFGSGVRDAFTKKAKELGFEVAPAISYDAASVADLTTQVTQVKASGADVLAVAGYYRDGVLVAKAVSSVKPAVNAVYGVADGAFDLPQFPKDAGAAGEGYFDANYHPDFTKQTTKDLAALYKKKYNDDIRTGAVLSYDSVRVLADAVERAKSTEPAKIREAITQTSLESLMAQSGPIAFDEKGENKGAIPILMQVQKDATNQVWPSNLAQAKPSYPAVGG